MTNLNPDNLVNGELLEIFGGPYDGEKAPVTVITLINLSLPSAGREMPDGSFYVRQGRKWMYAVRTETK